MKPSLFLILITVLIVSRLLIVSIHFPLTAHTDYFSTHLFSPHNSKILFHSYFVSFVMNRLISHKS